MLDPTEVIDFSLAARDSVPPGKSEVIKERTCDYSTSPCLAMNNMPVIIIMSALNTETPKSRGYLSWKD